MCVLMVREELPTQSPATKEERKRIPHSAASRFTIMPKSKPGIIFSSDDNEDHADKEYAVIEQSMSVAHRELPPLPGGRCTKNGRENYSDNDQQGEDEDKDGTLLLFYQYQEPPWNAAEHKKVLKEFLNLCKQHDVTGRGRVAPEGFNCTLTGLSSQIRVLCQALRDWKDMFHQTDFKFTDHLPRNKLFKSLSVRKTTELVAYGLEGTKAPSLAKFAGTHLTATEYHQVLKDPTAVVIDVRNSYETALGNLQPPPGGATWIDPQMRHSMEFQKWLSQKTTHDQLQNKKVLMYCTGGIRCERATALLNQLQQAGQVQTQGVYELQGGIDRYLKTYPKGGFWKGKNYLFDRRMEQVPAEKDVQQVEQEMNTVCSVCCHKWTMYRGKYFCKPCGVPVIVCPSCTKTAKENPHTLQCDLCRNGQDAPTLQEPLVPQLSQNDSSGITKNNKRKVDQAQPPDETNQQKKRSSAGGEQETETEVSNRLFLSKLPLTVTKTKLQKLLKGSGGATSTTTNTNTIQVLHWLTDRHTGAFYGSCLVQLESIQAARHVMEHLLPLTVDKKRVRITYAKQKNSSSTSTSTTDNWPPAALCDKEFPPIGR
jgi:predicted sulfurtransferase